MDYSCPKKSLESLEEAEMPFEEGTFLIPNMKRTGDNLITQAQFDELFQRAKNAGKYLDMNSYSFETLTDSIQREFCYSQQRYVFYIAAYQDSIQQNKKEKKFLEKARQFNQQLQDLITCLQYMDKIAIEGKQAPFVEPTETQEPFALQALLNSLAKEKEIGTYEKARLELMNKENEIFADKYTKEKVELEEQMTDINAELQLRQDRVLYTREKNQYAMMNLSLYTFANLAAVGLLLYFFRSKT
jgi:hypothetical protein